MGVHDGHRERLRNRFLNNGLDSLEDHEALELLLFYSISRRDTNPIAHALMKKFGSFSAVLSAPAEELETVEGVGPGTVTLFRLLPQIMRRAALDNRDIVLDTTERAGRHLIACFDGETNEVVYQLCLNRKGKLLCRKRLGEGGLDAAMLDVREIVRNAINHSASTVILSHNHPGGIAIPSQEDYTATDRVCTALETVGVWLRDHIVVAGKDYVSMRDSGYLRNSAH